MARLIIETSNRGFQQYHKIDSFPATLGRGYDNDVIISDHSVSAHHLEINLTESGEITATNLSTENGTRYQKKMLDAEAQPITLPAELVLGHSKVSVLSPDTEIEPTIIRDCEGIFCIFQSPLWAVILTLITCFSFLFESYINTPASRSLGHHINESSEAMLIMVLFFLVIAGISRLATHRWILTPAITVSCLLFLIPQFIDHSAHFLNYLFNTDSIRNIALSTANFALLPLLLIVFMVRVAHSKILAAIGISLLVSSPFMFIQIQDFVKKMTRSSFSPLPAYSKSLSAYDIRLSKSKPLDEFIDQASESISQKVKSDLEQYISDDKAFNNTQSKASEKAKM